ncbi:MAG: UbiA family prenyltransferase [Bryobacteraceae bacterium]
MIAGNDNARALLRGHVRIARFDHWVKNVYVLPGIAVAWTVDPGRFRSLHAADLVLGMTAVGLAASSNYVLNELLDAPFDRMHPQKCNRPAASGQVSVQWAWVQWIALFLLGVILSLQVSRTLAYTTAALWVMGWVYNVPPVRTKDIPFLDVLTEAVNNPLRFLAGWFMTGTQAVPITSLAVSYWMAGCYFMAIKRFAECRDMPSKETLVAYRPCFRYYNEQNLLISILFYGALSMLFLGAYMGRYRLEMALSFPLVAVVMAVYFALAFKPDSAAQRPEGLLKEPLLIVCVILCAAAMALLLWVDVPALHRMFTPTGVIGNARAGF